MSCRLKFVINVSLITSYNHVQLNNWAVCNQLIPKHDTKLQPGMGLQFGIPAFRLGSRAIRSSLSEQSPAVSWRMSPSGIQEIRLRRMHKVNPRWRALRRLSPAWIYVSQLSKQAWGCSWENREPRKQTGESRNWTPTASNGESQSSNHAWTSFERVQLAVPWYSYEWKKRNFWDFWEDYSYIYFWKIALFCLKSRPNHFLERSSPSTENVCHYFIFFCYCITACCEIGDHERPELYLQPSFPCQTVKCSIKKHLPLAMQIQRRTLLKIANKLYKQGKRIQWKIIDEDYRLFADGELVHSNVTCSTQGSPVHRVRMHGDNMHSSSANACPPVFKLSTSPWTARPDGSGRRDS